MKTEGSSANDHDDDLPDSGDNDSLDAGSITDESDSGSSGKVRRRIRVRKRIRIRKKPSMKKQFKKYAERTFWFLIIAGFITALIIMVVELDIRDERIKKQEKLKPKSTKSNY